jgi:hypothetical protein
VTVQITYFFDAKYDMPPGQGAGCAWSLGTASSITAGVSFVGGVILNPPEELTRPADWVAKGRGGPRFMQQLQTFGIDPESLSGCEWTLLRKMLVDNSDGYSAKDVAGVIRYVKYMQPISARY